MNCYRRMLLLRVAAVTALLTASGCGSVTTPTSFSDYNAKDGSFKCVSPDGWEAKGFGKGYRVARFTSGPAMIEITSDVKGSLLGDIAGGNTAENDVPDELKAVAQIHEFGLRAAEEKLGGYKEQDPVVIKTELGEGRKSKFTASTTLGGKVLGYRVTILGHDKRIVVYAHCPEKHWETLKPSFNKVIDSLGRGVPET